MSDKWDIEHRKEFARRAAATREVQRRFDDKERKQRREMAEDKLDAEFLEVAQAALIATQEQLVQLQRRLDTYGEATTQALEVNAEALEGVRQLLSGLLEAAYVLPDGRRVFRTEDGLRVFDEFGVELGPDVISPGAIDESHPTWEQYRDVLAEEEHLLQERKELHEFQKRLDDVQARIDSGELKADEVDDLESDLKAMMPEAVRRSLGNQDVGGQTRSEVADPAAPVSNADSETAPFRRSLEPSGLQPR